jgi:hypothetical protein
LLSPFVTPLVLIFCLPRCAEDIVLHIAENSVDVTGVGHISSFANFDFEKHGNPQYGAAVAASSLHQTKHGKMERSFLHFIRMYPAWQPPSQGCRMMETLAGFLQQHPDAIPPQTQVQQHQVSSPFSHTTATSMYTTVTSSTVPPVCLHIPIPTHTHTHTHTHTLSLSLSLAEIVSYFF